MNGLKARSSTRNYQRNGLEQTEKNKVKQIDSTKKNWFPINKKVLNS